MSSPNTTVGQRRSEEPASEPPRKRQKTQVNGETSSGGGSDARTRRKTACQTCRLRKIKCDGTRPVCGLCKTTNSSCEYTDPLPQKLTLETATQLLCSKLDRLQESLYSLQADTGLVGQHAFSPAEPSVAGATTDGGPVLRSYSNASHVEHVVAPEPAGDFLQIPAHRTTADAVLGWDVFEGRWPQMSLIGVHFRRTDGTADDGTDALFTPTGGLLPLNEERIPSLVDRFLVNVHTKNPVLDVQMLVKQSRLVAVKGLTWDGWSCLVLLASALGTIAKPFVASAATASSPEKDQNTWISDVPTSPEELQQGESYFVLACRRLGCLKHSILSAQCYFFAGVYLMYTLRPLLSWQYFIQASNTYQLYMKTSHNLAKDISSCQQLPITQRSDEDITRRRLEESMYWSCFKSESEFRVELPLPQSELSNYAHPSLFPAPPSPPGGRITDSAIIDEEDSHASPVAVISHGRSASFANEDSEIRRHAKELCNEEESWYYYLTEIALRRIGNRIINAFFGSRSHSWLQVKDMLPPALEYDAQVSAWSANLPLAMQHWEMSEAIRAPTISGLTGGIGSAVSRELSWAIDNRLLEMRSWLYQPFLYYLIHRRDVTSNLQLTHTQRHDGLLPPLSPVREEFMMVILKDTPTLTEDEAMLLYDLLCSGVDCNLKILDVRSLRHRHHGLWYDLRAAMCASLILLALVKSGHGSWISGGPEVLWAGNNADFAIGGKIGHVLTEFDFWSAESPDMIQHRTVLEQVTRLVMQDYI